MEISSIISILIVITALFAYVNTRILKLSGTIGVMVISLAFSVLLIVTGLIFPAIMDLAKDFIGKIDFSDVLLNVMLSFLLFAGALHTDVSLIKRNYRSISVFSILGVMLSALLVGTLLFFIFKAFHQPINFWY